MERESDQLDNLNLKLIEFQVRSFCWIAFSVLFPKKKW